PAIATGSVVAIDVDPRHDGDKTWACLVEELGIADAVDSTVQVKTGGGGMHYPFRAPEGVVVPGGNALLGPGVDVKAAGGYAIAPPSMHESGRRYEWESLHHPSNIEVAPLPDALLQRILGARASSSGRTSNNDGAHQKQEIYEGARNDTLYR